MSSVKVIKFPKRHNIAGQSGIQSEMERPRLYYKMLTLIRSAMVLFILSGKAEHKHGQENKNPRELKTKTKKNQMKESLMKERNRPKEKLKVMK